MSNAVQLTTGNAAMDAFMQSQLDFMTHLAERIDMLTDAFDDFRMRVNGIAGPASGTCSGFCNCFGNQTDVDT